MRLRIITDKQAQLIRSEVSYKGTTLTGVDNDLLNARAARYIMIRTLMQARKEPQRA